MCLMLLAGCSTHKVLTKTEMVKMLPPATLLQACPLPLWIGRTNQDLAVYILELQSIIKQCDNDKALLREWRDSQ